MESAGKQALIHPPHPQRFQVKSDGPFAGLGIKDRAAGRKIISQLLGVTVQGAAQAKYILIYPRAI